MRERDDQMNELLYSLCYYVLRRIRHVHSGIGPDCVLILTDPSSSTGESIGSFRDGGSGSVGVATEMKLEVP